MSTWSEEDLLQVLRGASTCDMRLATCDARPRTKHHQSLLQQFTFFVLELPPLTYIPLSTCNSHYAVRFIETNHGCTRGHSTVRQCQKTQEIV